MDGLFKKLQEVTDLTSITAASGDGAAGSPGGGSSSNSRRLDELKLSDFLPGGVGNSIDSATREDILSGLTKCVQELTVSRQQAKDIKVEGINLQEEFSAYKVKVASWKEQMKASRAQDRKTIETLREAQTTAALVHCSANSSAGGKEGRSEEDAAAAVQKLATTEAYVQSLEEQVKVLKETIRDQADERDKVTVELSRCREKLKEAFDVNSSTNPVVDRSVSPDSGLNVDEGVARSPPSSSPSGSPTTQGGVDGRAVAALEKEIKTLKLRLDDGKDEVRMLVGHKQKLELQVMRAEEQADATQRSYTIAEDQHRSDIEKLQNQLHAAQQQLKNGQQQKMSVPKRELSKDAQATYIKGLEKELGSWREETSRLEGEVRALQQKLRVLGGGGEGKKKNTNSSSDSDDSSDHSAESDKDDGGDATQGEEGESGSLSPRLDHSRNKKSVVSFDSTTPARGGFPIDDSASPSSTAMWSLSPGGGFPPPAKSAETILLLEEQIRKHEYTIDSLGERLKQREATLVKVNDHMGELTVEVRAREDAVNEMFDENKMLKAEASVLRDRDATLNSEMNDIHLRFMETNEQCEVLAQQVDTEKDAHETTKRALTAVQADVSRRNESIRQLRNELGVVKAQVSHLSTKNQQQTSQLLSATTLAPSAAATVITVQQSSSSNASVHPGIGLGFPLWRSELTIQENILKLMSSTKFRSYAATAAVLFFLILFTFYQSTTIVDDDAQVELLHRCKAMMRNGQQAVGGQAAANALATAAALRK